MDELLTAVSAIEAADVHERTRETLGRLKTSVAFAVNLQRGMQVPGVDQKSFVAIKVPANVVGETTTEEIVGLIARNPESNEIGGNLRHAAIVLIVKDAVQGRVEA